MKKPKPYESPVKGPVKAFLDISRMSSDKSSKHQSPSHSPKASRQLTIIEVDVGKQKLSFAIDGRESVSNIMQQMESQYKQIKNIGRATLRGVILNQLRQKSSSKKPIEVEQSQVVDSQPEILLTAQNITELKSLFDRIGHEDGKLNFSRVLQMPQCSLRQLLLRAFHYRQPVFFADLVCFLYSQNLLQQILSGKISAS